MDPTLRICTHSRISPTASCAGNGSLALLADLRQVIAQTGSPWLVEESLCLGHCHSGPNVKGAPGGPILHRCTSARSVLERMADEWPHGLD